MSLGGGTSSALDTAVTQLDRGRRHLRDRRRQRERRRLPTLAGARRRRRSPWAPPPPPTPAPRSRTSAPASTSSRPARASPRPGTRATPPPADERHLDGDAARGGAAALYLQTNPTATPAQVAQALLGPDDGGPRRGRGDGVAEPPAVHGVPGGRCCRRYAAERPADAAGEPIDRERQRQLRGERERQLGHRHRRGVLRGRDAQGHRQLGAVRDLLGHAHRERWVAHPDRESLRRRRTTSVGRASWRSRSGTRRPPRSAWRNGGFESGTASWALSGNAYFSNGGNAHSGAGYSVLGVYDNASGTEYQTVTIPSTATGSLTFWLNVTSSESTTTVARPLLRGGPEHVGRAARHARHFLEPQQDGERRLHAAAFNVAAFRGQTVRVQFRATTDGALPTSFRVDDVSLR